MKSEIIVRRARRTDNKLVRCSFETSSCRFEERANEYLVKEFDLKEAVTLKRDASQSRISFANIQYAQPEVNETAQH